jgi:LysR family glycine cleavage system transcriptional activator
MDGEQEMARLPSLRGLQAFEAVARAGNLGSAAEQLRITPSAVSHRVRGLEEELGLQLLQRTHNGLRLTDAGRRYRAGVEDAFATLARATNDLLGPDLSRPLAVSLSSSIGVRWLMPRFDRFRTAHPEIEIAILSSNRSADLTSGEADLALRYGPGEWAGSLRGDLVLSCTVSPLCAPSVMEKIKGLTPAEALARSTLIRLSWDDWDAWLEAAGAGHVEPARKLTFPDFSIGVVAAVHGQGIVLGYSGFADAEIAAGTLVQPFELTVPVKNAYYVVYLEERFADPRVRAFRDWVVAEGRCQSA